MCTQNKKIILTIIGMLLISACSGSGSRAAPNQEPQQTRIRPVDGMTMIFVPAGEFKMGKAWSREAITHSVEVDSFWMDQTEVTNDHYRHCVETGVCSPPSTCAWGEPTYNDETKADHPVICVTWQAAQTFCNWAGGRLPTEAEWEYTARGPDGYIYPWGNNFDGTQTNSCDINCPHDDQKTTDYDDGFAQTSPAGNYPGGASWCGAFDMSGNVWEWVADWYSPYALSRQINPTGPENGSEKIIRGGSWYEYNKDGFLRMDHRHPYEPNANIYLIGFRCVVPAERMDIDQ